MALELTKELDNGSIGNYWRIGEIHLSLANENAKRPASCLVRLVMFKDENFAKVLNKTPMGVAQIQIEEADLPEKEIDALVAAIYAKAKTDKQFLGAIDS